MSVTLTYDRYHWHSYKVQIEHVDGCEYVILHGGRYDACAMLHKENCTNTSHIIDQIEKALEPVPLFPK